MRKPPMSVNDFQRWRATIPWTDGQIADAILETPSPSEFMRHKVETAAAYVRTGRLSGPLLAMALPFLVKACELCGKKALYRIGLVGRCRAHRDVPSAAKNARVATFEQRHFAIERAANDYDREQRKAESLKRLHVSRQAFRGGR